MESRTEDCGRRAPARRDGFALIEMVITATVLMIGSLTFLQLFAASTNVGSSNRETAVSDAAAQRVLEQLRAFEPPESVYALHNDSEQDDPMGETPLPGFTLNGFEVPGLTPVEGDQDGLVGELIFPIDPISGAFHPDFRPEDFSISNELLGGSLPAEVIAAYDRLLPVVVRVEWEHNGTVRRHEVAGLISPR